MADHTGPRCTRRKQANPRRKNVELEDMPEEVDLDHLGPSEGITKEPVITGEPDFEESRCSSSSESHNNNTNNNNNTSASKDGFHAPAGVSAKGTESPLPLNNRGVAMPSGVAANGCLGNGRQNEDLKTEEEKIQEYLQRSDTAVIYPEPVDGEGESTPENLVQPPTGTDEVPSEGKGTNKDFYLKCPHCDKVYPSIEALRSHLVAQHGASEGVSENGYACDKCSATFVLREQLEKHELLHSPTAQVVACKVCNKTFANVYRLQRHMISHDESAVLRKFKCPECEKAFKFKHHLKEHIRIHSGEKPFACPNCGKRFSHSGSYSSHMTSKKCLVVNLKVRRTVDKPLRTNNANGGGGHGTGGGLGSGGHGHALGGRRHPQGTYPPILPRGTENGLELSQAYGGSLMSTGMSPEHFALDFSHPSLPAYMSPYPLSLHSLMNPNHCSGLSPYTLPPPLASLSHMIRPSAITSKPLGLEDRVPSPVASRKSASPQQHEPEVLQTLLSSSSRDVSSPCSVSNSGGDLNAVKKILATVNATVSKQQQQIRLKNGLIQDMQSSTSPPVHPSPVHQMTTPPPPPPHESPPPRPSPAIVFSVDLKKNGFKGDDSHCRYCGDIFHSRIDLHQHERYLCKLNRDIQPAMMGDPLVSEQADDLPPPLTSSRSRSSGEGVECGGEIAHATFNGLSEPDDDNNSDDTDSTRDLSDDTVMTSDGRKVRMRSLISDDHLTVLRTHYESNPRPNKEDVHRIAAKIKFPPRVVQVWFQNMRARDKKRGRTFHDLYFTSPSENGSIAPHSPPPSSALPVKNFSAITTSSPYPPLMPPFNGGGISSRLPLPLFYSPSSAAAPTSYPLPPASSSLRLNGHCSSPFQTTFAVDHEQPLDLSFKSNPRSAFHRPESTMDEECEVLNLSQKSSRTPTPSHESNNTNNNNYVSTSITVSLPLNTTNSQQQQQQSLHSHHQQHILTNPICSAIKQECKVESSSLYKFIQREGGGLPTPISISPSLPSPRIVVNSSCKSEEIDTSSAHSGGDPRMTSPSPPPPLEAPRLHQILATPSSPSSEPTVNGTADSSGQVYSTDGSHSPCPSDEPLEIDETTNTPNKRCWKQMEGDESQVEMDDSSVGEDDRPQKRRKSWKQHKLDSEEGMYACDQCDKMFSKQSSLARHKYEHSGQRPHKCEVCGKAFKHKHHLTEHKRLHSGEKPFQCKKCLKRFSHSGSYSQHMNHRYSYCKPYRD